MCQKTEIAQTSGFGSHDNTFIGEQHNYGLNAIDAAQMAFSFFRQYYPQLREEALTEMRRLVDERLGKVPPDCIIPPKARIAVPALQYASITEEQAVRELFANLLTNSMNSEVCNSVHPSYIEIIKQLSEDDARILQYMSTHYFLPVVSISLLGGHAKVLANFSDIPEKLGCSNCYNIDGCFSNLIRLGLVYKDFPGLSALEKTIEALKNHPFYQKKHLEAQDDSKKMNMGPIVERAGLIMRTTFGTDFCKVCAMN